MKMWSGKKYSIVIAVLMVCVMSVPAAAQLDIRLGSDRRGWNDIHRNTQLSKAHDRFKTICHLPEWNREMALDSPLFVFFMPGQFH
jgi:hypothetical protein